MQYYLAINPKTGNWCISKTKDIAWSTGENVVLDTGTILALLRYHSRNITFW